MSNVNSSNNKNSRENAYWRDRVNTANEAILKSRDKELKKMILQYSKAYQEIQAELLSIYTTYGNLEGEVSYNTLLKTKRLEKMSKSIKKLLKEMGVKEEQFLKEELPKIFKESGKEMSKIFNIDFAIIPEEQIRQAINYPWSGAMFSDLIWDNKNRLLNSLNKVITRGIIEGKNITEMSHLLQNIMEKEAYVCRRLVRTETMHMINTGELEHYKKSGIKKVEYVYTEDYLPSGKPRYCEECASLGGNIYDIDKAPILPRHPNCRCTFIPVIEGV